MTAIGGARVAGWQNDEGPTHALRSFYRAPDGAPFAEWTNGERYRVWTVTGDGDFWTWTLIVPRLDETAIRDLGHLNSEGYEIQIRPDAAGLLVEIEGRWVE